MSTITPAPDTSDERLASLIQWTRKAGMPDVHALLQELQQHRLMVKRLETWAGQLEASLYPDHDILRLREVTAELRRLLKGRIDPALVSTIADHGAAQWPGTPRLTQEERDALQWAIAGCMGHDGGPSSEHHLAVLDRMFSGETSQLAVPGLSPEERGLLERWSAEMCPVPGPSLEFEHEHNARAALLNRLLRDKP